MTFSARLCVLLTALVFGWQLVTLIRLLYAQSFTFAEVLSYVGVISFSPILYLLIRLVYWLIQGKRSESDIKSLKILYAVWSCSALLGSGFFVWFCL